MTCPKCSNPDAVYIGRKAGVATNQCPRCGAQFPAPARAPRAPTVARTRETSDPEE